MKNETKKPQYASRLTAIEATGEVEDVDGTVVARNDLRTKRLSGRTRSDEDKRKDGRTEAQRDVDRITYSTAWRRLAGVTQVVTPFSDRPLIHNRLTHSQKVAQVARSAAEVILNDPRKYDHALIGRLGGLDVDVCVAAAMAHDIGHPPFGHVGESILDRIARAESDALGNPKAALSLEDGFEGNAQSLRIVVKGQVRSSEYQGLDLSYATLAAIAKYPWCRETTKGTKKAHEDAISLHTTRDARKKKEDADYRRRWRKFNFYREHSDVLAKTRRFVFQTLGNDTQTLEASIMDMADDISYSIHDLEDFLLMGGILNTSAIRSELNEYGKCSDAVVAGKSFDEVKYKGRIGELAKRLELDYSGWFDPYMLCAAAAELANDSKNIFAKNLSVSRDAAIHTWATNQVEHFLQGLELSDSPLWTNGPHISLSREAWHEVQLLKYITKTYVIQHPDMALLQHGQESILLELVDMLVAWSGNDKDRLPEKLLNDMLMSERIASDPDLAGYDRGHFAHGPNVNRAFVDYICSLTDEECTSVHRKLKGIAVHHPFGYAG